MSFSKNLTITVRNTVAQLDEPLYVYEKDRNLIMYFKIMDYKYKFDKNPTNVLASVDDIMEAYATIVDPNGYELTRQYGEVIEDEIKFIITDDLIDELDEIGTYRIQFHIKCQHSEFTIPEISFEVLERLKGFKTVTDEGEVGDEILNNSESFIDAEGKLHLVWQEGDTISSVRLNQMVQVINNAVDEEHQRQINEVNRENRANAKLEELETRFSALTTSQQQSAEVIDARDGEASLKARLDRDIEKAKQVYVNVEGSNISTDSSSGYLKDVEILGNTVQDASNLADIRSVGDKVEGQELHEIPVLSRGKNLFDGELEPGTYRYNNGVKMPSTTEIRSVYKIKVNPNSNYLISSNKPTGNIGVYYYDSKENFIKSDYDGGQKIVTTEDTHFIAFRFTNLDLDRTVQLEEGTVVTPYEPYQEDKLTIISPVQLEKVGDVSDRIIEKDGVWGVEKNIYTELLNGQYNFEKGNISENTAIYQRLFSNLKANSNDITCILSDKFLGVKNNDWVLDKESVFLNSEGYVQFRVNHTTIGDMNFAEYTTENNILFKAQLREPQFIPLPYDQQVKLRTFANKTNISFDCEIEGTIKAQVPKSLGATVNTHTTQISNLNKELDRVKKLEESTVSTVETESDFTTVEATSNGYFEDVKLEGKTLVNLWGNKSSDFLYSGQTSFNSSTQCIEYTSTTNRFSNCFTKNNTQYKPDTKYTIIVNVFENTFTTTAVILKVSSDPSGGSDLGVSRETINIQGGFVGVKIFTITTLSDLSNSRIAIRTYVNNVNAEVGVKLKFKMIILEGDHTQNPPSYFEGLKSVGDGTDEIVVSSVKGDGNLFSSDFWESGFINDSTGSYSDDITYVRTKKIRVLPNTLYIFKGYTRRIYYYDITGNFISKFDIGGGTFLEQTNSFTTPSNCAYIALRYDLKTSSSIITSLDTLKQYDTIICKNALKDGLIYQSDKKRLLYYNNETQTWEKPILREWDSIEKHTDGKYYYHQRSGEVVLNGSEDWGIDNNATKETSLHFRTNGASYNLKPSYTNHISAEIICDKFAPRSGDFVWCTDTQNPNGVYEGIAINTNSFICVRVLKSKLSTQDVAGFKAWLQANNVTVVYQLAEEKVYECTNIDLITYANETNYIVESGAIVPKSTLKVHSNIANVISALQKKVSVLESNYVTLFNTITAAFNSLE